MEICPNDQTEYFLNHLNYFVKNKLRSQKIESCLNEYNYLLFVVIQKTINSRLKKNLVDFCEENLHWVRCSSKHWKENWECPCTLIALFSAFSCLTSDQSLLYQGLVWSLKLYWSKYPLKGISISQKGADLSPEIQRVIRIPWWVVTSQNFSISNDKLVSWWLQFPFDFILQNNN